MKLTTEVKLRKIDWFFLWLGSVDFCYSLAAAMITEKIFWLIWVIFFFFFLIGYLIAAWLNYQFKQNETLRIQE